MIAAVLALDSYVLGVGEGRLEGWNKVKESGKMDRCDVLCVPHVKKKNMMVGFKGFGAQCGSLDVVLWLRMRSRAVVVAFVVAVARARVR